MGLLVDTVVVAAPNSGGRQYPFIIDTGSRTTIISSAVASLENLLKLNIGKKFIPGIGGGVGCNWFVGDLELSRSNRRVQMPILVPTKKQNFNLLGLDYMKMSFGSLTIGNRKYPFTPVYPNPDDSEWVIGLAFWDKG